MPATVPDDHVFDRERPTLFSVAYRVLGSVADAEDVIQDAWLRWQSVDAGTIEKPERYLVRITARLALDHLRSARVRRETYVGEWLPEPLMAQSLVGPTSAVGADGADRAEAAETVSLAMLRLLESLTPLERVVFVLHEAFGFAYAEIAEAVGSTSDATRQTGVRARAHIADRQSRYDADRAVAHRAAERFLSACQGGDLESLLAVLSPDVALISDGGGLAQAPRKPIVGAELVARAMLTFAGRPPADPTTRIVDINGTPGILVYSAGTPSVAVVPLLRDGGIVELLLMANPEKLSGLA